MRLDAYGGCHLHSRGGGAGRGGGWSGGGGEVRVKVWVKVWVMVWVIVWVIVWVKVWVRMRMRAMAAAVATSRETSRMRSGWGTTRSIATSSAERELATATAAVMKRRSGMVVASHLERVLSRGEAGATQGRWRVDTRRMGGRSRVRPRWRRARLRQRAGPGEGEGEGTGFEFASHMTAPKDMPGKMKKLLTCGVARGAAP